MIRFEKAIEKFLVLLMAAIVFNVLWQVFSRYILNAPSSFTDELARYLLVWIGFIGAAYATGKNLHLSINLIPSGMETPRFTFFLKKFSPIVVGVFALLVLVLGGSRLVYITFYLGQSSPSLEIPLSFIYLALPLSGIIIILYSVRDLLKEPKARL